MGLDNTSMRVSFVRRTLPDDALQSDTPLPRRALRARAGAHPTPWCSARLACVFAAPGLARNGIRLGRPPLQRSSGLVVLELLPTESLGRVLALPAALRQGALRGQLPGGDAWRCGADGRAAADDSLLHRRPSGYPLSRLARLEMGARRSPCSTVHRLRRRVCAPQDTEMLPASNFVCEFGECVRPTSPLLGACVLACLLASYKFASFPDSPHRAT